MVGTVAAPEMASSLCLPYRYNPHVFRRAAKQALSSLVAFNNLTPLHRRHNRNRIFSPAHASAAIDANKELRSTDLVALEYAELNLTEKISGVCSIFRNHPFLCGFGEGSLSNLQLGMV